MHCVVLRHWISLSFTFLLCKMGLTSSPGSPWVVRRDGSGGSLPPLPLLWEMPVLMAVRLPHGPQAYPNMVHATPIAWTGHYAFCDSVSPAMKWKRKGLDR